MQHFPKRGGLALLPILACLAAPLPAVAAGRYLHLRDANALANIAAHKISGTRTGPCQRTSSRTASCAVRWTHEFAVCTYHVQVGTTSGGGFFYRSGRPDCHVVDPGNQ